MLAMPIAGRLTDKTGVGRIVPVGPGDRRASRSLGLTQLGADTSYWLLGAVLFVMGMGMGFDDDADVLRRDADAAQAPQVARASTTLNILQQVGASIGTAVLSVMLAGALTDQLPAVGGGGRRPGARAAGRARAARAAMAEAFGQTFWWALGCSCWRSWARSSCRVTGRRRPSRKRTTTRRRCWSASKSGFTAGLRGYSIPYVSVRNSESGIDDNYKWIALSNTTLGVLMATVNASILLIALPDIFRGIHIDPLAPGNTNYLLWMILGFLVVTAVLVVSFGRLGDMYGRVRMYNLGFAIFTVVLDPAVGHLDDGSPARCG